MLNDAVQRLNVTFAEELLKGGTNPLPMGPSQNTALHVACTVGSVDCVALLLKFGCGVDVQNVAGDTALHLCARGGQLECATALLGAGANKGMKNSNQETPHESMKNAMMHLQNPNQNFMKTLDLLRS